MRIGLEQAFRGAGAFLALTTWRIAGPADKCYTGGAARRIAPECFEKNFTFPEFMESCQTRQQRDHRRHGSQKTGGCGHVYTGDYLTHRSKKNDLKALLSEHSQSPHPRIHQPRLGEEGGQASRWAFARGSGNQVLSTRL